MTPVEPVQPFVSVLIAARNEAANVVACLHSLSRQSYPVRSYEVLVADDQSEDDTAQLVETFISGKDNYHLVRVTGYLGHARGKGNAIAHLVRQAKGELLLFTDADTVCPPSWISQMVARFQPETGVLTGVTTVQGRHLFYRMQAVDWLTALLVMRGLTWLGVGVTALGNNMMISREAYDRVGGYESMPFSLTEDFALFQALRAQGYKGDQTVREGVLVHTQPMWTITDWFQQRKRWMTGAMQVQRLGIMAFFGQFAWYPVCFIGSMYWGDVMWQMAIGRYAAVSLVAVFAVARLRKWYLLPFALLYEAYFTLFFGALCIYYFMPTAVAWKGRTYEQPRAQPVVQPQPSEG